MFGSGYSESETGSAILVCEGGRLVVNTGFGLRKSELRKIRIRFFEGWILIRNRGVMARSEWIAGYGLKKFEVQRIIRIRFFKGLDPDPYT